MAVFIKEIGADADVVLSFVGSITKRYSKTLGDYLSHGRLNYSSVDQLRIDQASPSYAVVMGINTTNIKRTSRALTAILDFVGAHALPLKNYIFVSADILFNKGGINYSNTNYILVDGPQPVWWHTQFPSLYLSFAPVISIFYQFRTRVMSATLDFVSLKNNIVRRNLTGGPIGLDYSFINTTMLLDRGLSVQSAVLSFTGNQRPRGNKTLTAIQDFIGTSTRTVQGFLFDRVPRFKIDYDSINNISIDGNTLFRGAANGYINEVSHLSFRKILQQTLLAVLDFVSSQSTKVQKTFTASTSPTATLIKSAVKLITATTGPTAVFISRKINLYYVAIAAGLGLTAAQFPTFLKWIQQQLAIRARALNIRSRNKYTTIKVVGPQEMAYKRGTNIEFEATFTDADGTLYDPDVNTVKLQIRKPDLTILTGWSFADNKVMNKVSTGVYRLTYQSTTSDITGTYLVESTGAVGAIVTLDDAKIQVKA